MATTDTYSGLEIISQQALDENMARLAEIADDISKGYLLRLKECEVVQSVRDLYNNRQKSNVELFKIERMTYERDENATDKFASVFRVLSDVHNSVFLLLKSNWVISLADQESWTI